MTTARDIFKKADSMISAKSLSDLTSSHILESEGVLSASFKDYDRLLPNINFSKPENFTKYGSAELYYSSAILNICNNYPWDGSKKQKLEWRNNASYLDNYIFENEYPKHTGSITIGKNFGTASVTNQGYYNTPARVEYIKVGPGLATGTKFNISEDRTSAFSFNSDNGCCFEFYLKQDRWSSDLATASLQIVFHFSANGADLTGTNWGLPSVNPPTFELFCLTTGTDLALNWWVEGLFGSAYYFNAFNFSEWNRFSFNILSGGLIENWKNGVKINPSPSGVGYDQMYWINKPTTISMSGNIGAFASVADGIFNLTYGVSAGWNKFSGSLDDFRFWRRSRTDKEIVSNWFTTVDGGFDNDELLNPDMGFYYKFNEKTLGTHSIDACVLDYSGRKNHATWIGYQSGSRIEYSPIENEVPDIINTFSSSDVQNLFYSKTERGRAYDLSNNASIVNMMPSFFSDLDETQDFAKLTQIIASMFDRMWLQINSLTSLRDSSYFQSGSLSPEIIIKAINSSGLNISTILDDYSLREIIYQNFDGMNFEKSVENIKQIIYKNIYNNLIYIFKSKGTEKSIKSIFRAFGVDDDVLKVKAYSKNSTIEIDGTKKIDTVRRKNLLDLSGKNDFQNMNCNVFNQYIETESSSISFLSSTTALDFRKTFETTILFPKKFGIYDSNFIPFLNSNLSASLFGFYQMTDSLGESSKDCTFKNGGSKFNAFAVQKSPSSKDAKFVFILSQSNINTIYTETDWYENVYDNTKWTFSARYFISGTNHSNDNFAYIFSDYQTKSFNIFAVNEIGGNIIHTFSITTDLYHTETNEHSQFFADKNKFYIGANRTNLTGNVLNPTQAEFYNFRMWNEYLEDLDIINHALDVHNYGIGSASWNYRSRENSPNVPGANEFSLYIPKEESLLINWDFENNYVPNSAGIFTVSSLRGASIYSGGYKGVNEYAIPIGPNYSAMGYGFNSGAIIIDKNYALEQKNRVPTDYFSYDDISLDDDVNKYFGRKIEPVEFFYTIENSIYDVISEDMLNMFSSIDEFNNLYGHPTDLYKMEYKVLRIMRNLFFSKIQNTKIDFDKYFSYYKWLDSAISNIVRQLFPLSTSGDTNIRNVIESHVLEKNKYVWNSINFSQRNMTSSLIGNLKSTGLQKKYVPPS